MDNKYFLYIRKSTDEDDRQVLSLEAQKTELLEFAEKENLNIIDIFIESQTAKKPGRPIFNNMLDKIEKNKANGILAWHPDRLARNSVDGGKIIYLVDSEEIKSLKFPTFWFEATPQGKFMLNIAFGQSKYFVDNLSENTKRGLRQKLRRGELPGPAPIGYLNDLRKHNIIKDPQKFNLVRKIFKLYSTGNYTIKFLRDTITSVGLLSKHNKALAVSTIQHILKNPFYYGLIRYNNEIFRGSHEPMIAKKLFDKCQEVISQHSKPKKKQIKKYAFRGLFKCGECGCAITSETQKGHNYYRCTKKKIKCSQKYIREEILSQQISEIIQKVSLFPSCADWIIQELEKQNKQEEQDGNSFVQNLKEKLYNYENKLDKLLDSHLEELISKEEYASKKQKILNEKIDIEEKLEGFEQKGNHWLERAKKFILDAKQAKIIASQKNLSTKRDFLKKIGSNLILQEREIRVIPQKPWEILWELPTFATAKEALSAKKTIWLRGSGSNRRPTG